jgi:Uma2 family endonuclease
MATVSSPQQAGRMPGHLELPFDDGKPVKNSLEHLQSVVLTDSIRPVVRKLYPEERYFIGQDCGIYWREVEPPLDGVKAPDWYFVPDVPALLDGERRRSYVLWRELIAPLLLIEFASGDGREERDHTPYEGKFWVYEKVIRPAFYVIWEPFAPRLGVHHFVENAYAPLAPNARGHYEIGPLQIELGIWRGKIDNTEGPWLRFWSLEGELLPGGWEQAELEREEKERALKLAEQERAQREQIEQRAAAMAEKLKALGHDPNTV